MDIKKARAEMLRLMQDDNELYEKAKDILGEVGFTVYSCTKEILERVVNGEDLKELIKSANTEQVFIHELERKLKRQKTDGLESFFNAFENPNTKERLFILLGETGVGKSYVIEKRYPNIVQYACNRSMDTYSLLYYLADNGNGLAPHPTPFLKALTDGGKVFLDEMNELPHETLMFLQGITDEKSSIVIGDQTVAISPEFKLIAALNPPSETDERIPLGDALLSRSVGYVLRMTDDLLCKRLNVTKDWLYKVRTLWNYIRNSNLIDVRPLTFRDYQRFSTYDFETQLVYKVSMGDVSNITAMDKIMETGEYQRLLEDVLNA